MEDQVRDLRAELEAAAERQQPRSELFPERFVLRHGIAYPWRPRPRGIRQRKAKFCFMNSTNLALQKPGFTYVEGFALTEIPVKMAVHHAWVIDAEGFVVDVTWDAPGAAYLGVPFQTRYLARVVSQENVYRPMLEWNSPLLTGAHKIADALLFTAFHSETTGTGSPH